MTTLNTIIEEEKKKFEKLEYIIGDINGYEPDGEINTLCSQAQQEVNKLKELRATAMQRAYEAGAEAERERIWISLLEWIEINESWDEFGKENPHIFANELREFLRSLTPLPDNK